MFGLNNKALYETLYEIKQAKDACNKVTQGIGKTTRIMLDAFEKANKENKELLTAIYGLLLSSLRPDKTTDYRSGSN